MIQLTKSLEHVIKQEQDILTQNHSQNVQTNYFRNRLHFTNNIIQCRIGKNILLTSDKSYH